MESGGCLRFGRCIGHGRCIRKALAVDKPEAEFGARRPVDVE